MTFPQARIATTTLVSLGLLMGGPAFSADTEFSNQTKQTIYLHGYGNQLRGDTAIHLTVHQPGPSAKSTEENKGEHKDLPAARLLTRAWDPADLVIPLPPKAGVRFSVATAPTAGMETLSFAIHAQAPPMPFVVGDTGMRVSYQVGASAEGEFMDTLEGYRASSKAVAYQTSIHPTFTFKDWTPVRNLLLVESTKTSSYCLVQ
jgi:hypothetical protein